MSWRLQAIWLGLLVLAQLGDIFTTVFGITHGTVEGNWLVAGALAYGGLTLFWVLKLAVAAAMAGAVVLVRRVARHYSYERAAVLQQIALRGTQIGVLALTLVSINNLAVLGRIPLWPSF